MILSCAAFSLGFAQVFVTAMLHTAKPPVGKTKSFKVAVIDVDERLSAMNCWMHGLTLRAVRSMAPSKKAAAGNCVLGPTPLLSYAQGAETSVAFVMPQ